MNWGLAIAWLVRKVAGSSENTGETQEKQLWMSKRPAVYLAYRSGDILMIVRHTFPNLMDLISGALVPAYIAKHVFSNKDKIADAMSSGKPYLFSSPTGETIEIRMDEDV